MLKATMAFFCLSFLPKLSTNEKVQYTIESKFISVKHSNTYNATFSSKSLSCVSQKKNGLRKKSASPQNIIIFNSLSGECTCNGVHLKFEKNDILWDGKKELPKGMSLLSAPTLLLSENTLGAISLAYHPEYFQKLANGEFRHQVSTKTIGLIYTLKVIPSDKNDNQITLHCQAISNHLKGREIIKSVNLDIGKPIIETSEYRPANAENITLADWSMIYAHPGTRPTKSNYMLYTFIRVSRNTSKN